MTLDILAKCMILPAKPIGKVCGKKNHLKDLILPNWTLIPALMPNLQLRGLMRVVSWIGFVL